MMYSNILIPTDGSEASERIIRFICRIGNTFPAEIHVVHAVEVPRSLPLNECPPDKLNAAREIISKALDVAEECGVNIKTQIIFARTAEDSILETAEQLRCDTIALAQGKSRMRLIANSSMNIYSRAKCNVWLINLK